MPAPYTPAIHFTPPCYVTGSPPHDIAAALFVNETWHVMAGCWHSGGWQHVRSSDLVHWELVGEPSDFGGSGGMIVDADGGVAAFADDVNAVWSTNEELSKWTSKVELFSPEIEGKDPIMWWDEGRLFAAVASRGLGYGSEELWESTTQKVAGPWTSSNSTLLEVRRAFGMNETLEFVTPDYFYLNETAVFLTSLYGPMAQGGVYNFAAVFAGERPPPGRELSRNASLDRVVDWSCFGPDLGLAVANGRTQFGCCPKTAADSSGRRVLFGWLQNGGSNAGEPDREKSSDVVRSNNTMTLPRDLSIGCDGAIRQRFVPELAVLRQTLALNATVAPPNEDGPSTSGLLPDVVDGPRFEIVASLRGALRGTVSIIVLAAPDLAEYTAIRLDADNRTVALDRTRSGSALDADVRAGPWLESPCESIHPGDARIHIYVDHSVVSLILDNQTALTAWVHPSQPYTSGRVGVFYQGPDAPDVDMQIWPLAPAKNASFFAGSQ